MAEFSIPPHAPSPDLPPTDIPPGEPRLACSQCHEYSEEIEEVSPNSCVGCHERGGYSIGAALEALIEAGHPSVLPMIKVVPKDCLMCHREGFGQLLHQRHLFESQKFVPHFQTGCVRCHRMEESGIPLIENDPLE